MRKTTHVKIYYKDGSTYNVRRGYINKTTYDMVKSSGYYVVEVWNHIKTEYGEISHHTYNKIGIDLVDYIEVTELSGSKTVYGDMFHQEQITDVQGKELL